MSIVLVGSTSGSVTLQEPAVAGTTVLDLPATSGTVLTSASTGISASNITTGTLPLAQGGSGTTTGQAIVPIQTVNLSGLTSFNFSVSAYPQYIVYLNNLGGSVASANVLLTASNDGGSSYIGSWNWRTNLLSVAGATTVLNNDSSNGSSMYIWYDIWNGAAPSGTNGYVMIAGTSYYGANKRATCVAYMGGQQQGGQSLQLHMGQEQDDGKQFNNIRIFLSSGTFYGNSTALICGVKAI
jgi:hypothetical protein